MIIFEAANLYTKTSFMAHLATKRYSYKSQFFILMGLLCLGFLASQLITLLALSSKVHIGSTEKEMMDKLFVPENTNLLRVV